MSDLSKWNFCQHALNRANQRGISQDTLRFVLENADVWLYAGEGCRSIRLSKKLLSQLVRQGSAASRVERAAGIVLIIDPETKTVVTALHDHGSKCGRRYRKQFPTRSKKSRKRRGALDLIIHLSPASQMDELGPNNPFDNPAVGKRWAA